MKKNLLPLLLLFLIISCKKEKEQPSELTNSTQDLSIENLTVFLSKTLNIDKNQITYNQSDSIFTIEKDMRISIKDAEKRFKDQTKKIKTPTTQHYKGAYLVSDSYISNIKVYTRAGVPNDWRTAIQQAMLVWNQTLTRVRFISSNYDDADIRINGSDEGSSGPVASAYLPWITYQPGNEIDINYYYNYLSANEKLFTIVHELGHTIGFKHTNLSEGTFINGTPTSDPNSFMNSFVLPWSGFTSGDLTAINTIYPYTTTFLSDSMTEFFKKTNCPTGYLGGVVGYTVNTGAYHSVVSQQEANTYARLDILNNGPIFANTVGNCHLIYIDGDLKVPTSGSYQYTFLYRPLGASIVWSTYPPLEIVGSNTDTSVMIRYIEGSPENDIIGLLIATVGGQEYYKDLMVKH